MVDGADLGLLRQTLADPNGNALTPGGRSRCSVIGTSGDCDILDVVVLARFLRDLGPGLDLVCSALTD